MNVSAQPGVVCEIPTWIVGIFIDHNRVTRPIPAGHETDVGGRYAEVESPEPEASGTAAPEMKDMSRAEPAREAAVSPRMVHVIPRIAAGVSNPLAVIVNMRRFGMPLGIVKIPLGGATRRFRPRSRSFTMSGGRRPVRRNVSASNTALRSFVAFLRQ